MVPQNPSLSEVHESIDTTLPRKGWRRILAYFGPAYLVSVGYMDPGNWATDLQGGAQFGYQLIWVLLLSNIMALLLQSLSASWVLCADAIWRRPIEKPIQLPLIFACIF